MSIEKKTVAKVAELACIEVPEEKLEKLTPDLQNILGWVEQLSEIDTSQVEPLSNVANAKTPMREDCVTDGNIRDEILKNAPSSREGFFEVQKIVE